MASSSAAGVSQMPSNLNGDDAPEDPSPPATSEFFPELLPPRLFATDRYPVSGRINSYSKPEYLLELVEVLAGTPEFEWLKSSCFGGLFRLPVRNTSISGKLVHQILCRSLVTDKRHEMWFVFGGRPFRFSLREFRILTGLNCGQYPSQQAFTKMITPVKKNVFYLHKLIGPNNTYTIPEVINILKEDKDAEEAEKMDTDRRKRLAVLVIVDGILVCDTSKVVATLETTEMLKDLDAFMQYPWGRKSFELTLEMVKVGKVNRNVNVLAGKLSQSHTATHGFTISFQLLILQAIPLLQQFLPHLDPHLTFIDRPVSHLTTCKTYHNSNILQVEMDPDLQVQSILHTEDPEVIQDYSWVDELDDDGVDYIVNNLKGGHIFNKEDWHGGFDDFPLLSLPVKAKVKEAPAKRVKKSFFKKHIKTKFVEPDIEDDVARTFKVDPVTAEELLREVDRRNKEHSAKIEQMVAVGRAIDRDEIRDHILSVLREQGLLKSPVNVNHTELLNQMNNSIWTDYGEGLPQIFNTINKVITDPQIGEEGNQSKNQLSDDDHFEHGTSGDQYSCSSESRGNGDNYSEIGLGDDDGQEVVYNQDGNAKSHTVEDSDENMAQLGANVPVQNSANVDLGLGDAGRQEVVHNQESNAKSHNPEDYDVNMAQMGANVTVQNSEDVDIGLGDDDGQEDVHNQDGNAKSHTVEDSDENMAQLGANVPLQNSANVDLGLGDAGGQEVVHNQESNAKSHNPQDYDEKMEQMGANVTDQNSENVDIGLGDDDGQEFVHKQESNAKSHNPEDYDVNMAQMRAIATDQNSENVDIGFGDVDAIKVVPNEVISREAHGHEDLSDKGTDSVGNSKLHQDLSSTSEFSTSQTSETSPTEPMSTSSKKRSLKSASTKLPSKRRRKKPTRFGYESSCKKPILPRPSERGDYSPFRVVKPEIKKKFMSTLRAYKQKNYIIDGHSVKSSFFEDIYTPKHWVHSPHMEVMLSLLWKTCGEDFSKSRVAVLDTWFTYILCNDHSRFQQQKNKSAFPWNNVIKNYVRGIVPGRSSNMAWFTDVDTVYVPMNWGKRHWVACVIYLKEGKILILDPFIDHNDARKLPRLMKPLLDMLPFAIQEFVTPAPAHCPLPSAFTFDRALDVYQNKRTGDCGPLAVKFIELHAQGLSLDDITDKMVDEMRMSFAVDIYEEFIVSLG